MHATHKHEGPVLLREDRARLAPPLAHLCHLCGALRSAARPSRLQNASSLYRSICKPDTGFQLARESWHRVVDEINFCTVPEQHNEVATPMEVWYGTMARSWQSSSELELSWSDGQLPPVPPPSYSGRIFHRLTCTSCRVRSGTRSQQVLPDPSLIDGGDDTAGTAIPMLRGGGQWAVGGGDSSQGGKAKLHAVYRLQSLGNANQFRR